MTVMPNMQKGVQWPCLIVSFFVIYTVFAFDMISLSSILVYLLREHPVDSQESAYTFRVPSQLGESRQHLSADEETPWYCGRTQSDVGPHHGNYCRNDNGREDVGPLKSYYSDHRHSESFADMDRLSTSACHHSTSNSRSLCAEKTNYSPAQPTSVAVSLCNLFLYF